MNAKGIARNYECLTALERFSLILAASGRGDESERERLVRASRTMTMSMPDHSPYARAFTELSYLTFMELVEEATRYRDAFVHGHDTPIGSNDQAPEEKDPSKSKPSETREKLDASLEGDSASELVDDYSAGLRSLDLALAAGYVFRTKAEGWKLFCQGLHVPPFLLWEGLPGWERLQQTLSLAEQAAFEPEGFLSWLNRIRPKGKPDLREIPLNVEVIAKTNEEIFRERVGWWGGTSARQ
jgi:hypothetical protein